MGRPAGWMRQLTGRSAMRSPGAPSLRHEIDRRSWQTKTKSRLALFTYIEGWYNPRRRHGALGQTSPANFRRKHIDKTRSQPSLGEHGIPTVGDRAVSATPPVDIRAPELIDPT